MSHCDDEGEVINTKVQVVGYNEPERKKFMKSTRQGLKDWADKLRAELSYEAKFITEHKLIVLLIVWAVLALFMLTVRPPGNKITLLTSAEGTAYYLYGMKYKDILSKSGVDVEIIKTKGSVENARRLADISDAADAAFIQAGTVTPEQASGIRSLGKLFYEPLWLFYRSPKKNEPLETLTDLRGLVVNIGPEGSGTNLLVRKVLQTIGSNNAKQINTDPTPDGISELSSGHLDALMTVDQSDTDNIKKLVNIPGVRLASFRRAAAYSDNIEYLDKIVIPMGALDFVKNFPPEDTPAISTTAELLVKETLHPSHQLLLLEAAQKIHSKGSNFTKAGEFPAIGGGEYIFPSEQAKMFYKGERPYLSRYLPIWIAESINRIIFYLLPLAIIAYPIIKELMNYLVRRGRFKLQVLYLQLRKIESRAREDINEEERSTLAERVGFLEQEALQLRIPKEVYGDYYLLSKNIEYVRDIVNSR